MTKHARVPVYVILSAYTAALVLWRDKVPDGLFNDTAEEALRGLYLVEGHHLEVINVRGGNPIETLYLYLVGGMAHMLGPTTISIQLTSWLFALACILLIWKLTEAIDSAIPPWIPVLTAASSLWLFHYARSGLRAIAAPFFLAAFALLLDRAERRLADRIPAAVCGVVLGLSIYGYTACRILPLAFIAYAAFRVIRDGDNRKALVQCYGTIVAGALFMSIPNLVFFLGHPKVYLSRGSYVFVGTVSEKAVNLLSSALVPFYYPNMYRDVVGHGFFFDPISAAFAGLGYAPVHIIFAAALVIGLAGITRFIDRPAYAFLLSAWIVTILSIGAAGPSLTRMLILLPVYIVLAALGFGILVTKFPRLRTGTLVLILWVGVSGGYAYFFRLGASQAYLDYFSPAATSVAQRAELLARQGRRVLCVLAKDGAVVDFLTADQGARVKTIDFYLRPLDPSQIPFNEFRPNDLLIENIPRFNVLRFPPTWHIEKEERFDHVEFPN